MKPFLTPWDRSFHLGWFPEAQLVKLTIGGTPECLRGLKALFVSDVHLRSCVSDESLDALIRQMAATKADLLLLGGDYAESPGDCLRFFRALEKAAFPMGGYAVVGNNDLESLPTLRETMARARVTLLHNESRRISLPGGALEIGGCDDHKYGAPRTKGLFGEGAYRILLSHFPCMPECECELLLCGHTHGGQMNLLGLTPYCLPFERKFHMLAVRGLHQIGGMQMLVGNGIGVSRLPLRFGAAAQICLLDFGK